MELEISKRCSYSKEGKGWIGCPPDSKSHSNVSMFKRLCDKRKQQKTNQMQLQKFMETNKNIHHLNPFSSFIYELDQRIVNESHNNEKDNRQGDEDIVDLDLLVNKQPLISSPFSQSERIYHLDMWKPPRHYSKADIEFEKPPNTKFASFTSSAALVQRLQKILEEKERNNNLLRKHLLKIHKESSILAEEVARRERPDGATLYRENNLLKDQLERCLRENALLRGLYMQSTNTALKKLKETEELNSRFQLQSRVHSAPSKICPRMVLRQKMRMKSAYPTKKGFAVHQL